MPRREPRNRWTVEAGIHRQGPEFHFLGKIEEHCENRTVAYLGLIK